MPTPIEWFLQEERQGDARRQLGASQEWDWRSGNFVRFVDRDEYLRSVRFRLHEILAYQATHPRAPIDRRYIASPISTPPVHSDTHEDRRRVRLLQCLQAALQSRRVKHKMLREQQAAIPFDAMVKQATEDSLLLESAWNSRSNQAMFCTQAAVNDFKTVFNLPDQVSPEDLFNIDLDPTLHIYTPSMNCLNMGGYSNGSSRSMSNSSSRWRPIEKWIRSLQGHSSSSKSMYGGSSASIEEMEQVRPPSHSRSTIEKQSYFPTWQSLNMEALKCYADDIPAHLRQLSLADELPTFMPAKQASKETAHPNRRGLMHNTYHFESAALHGSSLSWSDPMQQLRSSSTTSQTYAPVDPYNQSIMQRQRMHPANDISVLYLGGPRGLPPRPPTRILNSNRHTNRFYN